MGRPEEKSLRKDTAPREPAKCLGVGGAQRLSWEVSLHTITEDSQSRNVPAFATQTPWGEVWSPGKRTHPPLNLAFPNSPVHDRG